MDTWLKTALWQQFGAAIDMLQDAINLCPDHLWTAALWKDPDDAAYGQFWFIAYHTLRWLDLYLTGSRANFVLPAPFIQGALPEKPYTKDEILTYLAHCGKKCQTTIEALTEEQARQRCVFEWMEPTFLELQLYNMRHVQEHGAQLNLFLGQHDISGMDWVSKARDSAE